MDSDITEEKTPATVLKNVIANTATSYTPFDEAVRTKNVDDIKKQRGRPRRRSVVSEIDNLLSSNSIQDLQTPRTIIGNFKQNTSLSSFTTFSTPTQSDTTFDLDKDPATLPRRRSSRISFLRRSLTPIENTSYSDFITPEVQKKYVGRKKPRYSEFRQSSNDKNDKQDTIDSFNEGFKTPALNAMVKVKGRKHPPTAKNHSLNESNTEDHPLQNTEKENIKAVSESEEVFDSPITQQRKSDKKSVSDTSETVGTVTKISNNSKIDEEANPKPGRRKRKPRLSVFMRSVNKRFEEESTITPADAIEKDLSSEANPVNQSTELISDEPVYTDSTMSNSTSSIENEDAESLLQKNSVFETNPSDSQAIGSLKENINIQENEKTGAERQINRKKQRRYSIFMRGVNKRLDEDPKIATTDADSIHDSPSKCDANEEILKNSKEDNNSSTTEIITSDIDSQIKDNNKMVHPKTKIGDDSLSSPTSISSSNQNELLHVEAKVSKKPRYSIFMGSVNERLDNDNDTDADSVHDSLTQDSDNELTPKNSTGDKNNLSLTEIITTDNDFNNASPMKDSDNEVQLESTSVDKNNSFANEMVTDDNSQKKVDSNVAQSKDCTIGNDSMSSLTVNSTPNKRKSRCDAQVHKKPRYSIFMTGVNKRLNEDSETTTSEAYSLNDSPTKSDDGLQSKSTAGEGSMSSSKRRSRGGNSSSLERDSAEQNRSSLSEFINDAEENNVSSTSNEISSLIPSTNVRKSPSVNETDNIGEKTPLSELNSSEQVSCSNNMNSSGEHDSVNHKIRQKPRLSQFMRRVKSRLRNEETNHVSSSSATKYRSSSASSASDENQASSNTNKLIDKSDDDNNNDEDFTETSFQTNLVTSTDVMVSEEKLKVTELSSKSADCSLPSNQRNMVDDDHAAVTPNRKKSSHRLSKSSGKKNVEASRKPIKKPMKKKSNQNLKKMHNPFARKFTKHFFQRFITSKLSSAALKTFENCAENYHTWVSDELFNNCSKKNSKIISGEDVIMLMKRQGFIRNLDSMNSFVEKNFPMELRSEIICRATPGNVLYPK
ncbi:Centromere protein T [Nymphon striatum]|nr:Centromere protein T [Nymphon striatum]